MSKKAFSTVKSLKESFVKEVIFGLYEEDNTPINEVSMIWENTPKGLEYKMVIPSKSWKVAAISQDLFEILNKYDNRGQLTPDVFYGYLIACGYVLI